VLAIHADRPLAAILRTRALEQLKGQDGFKDLAQVFKRVVNIIRKFGSKDDFSQWDRLTQDVEKNLLNRIESVEHKAASYLGTGDYSGLLAEIADLRSPVDQFFDQVLVDDPDPQVKEARIALLSRAERLFEHIADFSRISTV